MALTVISVKVRPRARTSALRASDDGAWQADVKAPPVDGKANAELIALVARHFGCRKAAVTIEGGAASRVKRVAIAIDEPGSRAAEAKPAAHRSPGMR